MKIIITGATGLVGEGVLLTCLAHPNISEVLIVNRKHFDFEHPKLRELIVRDFFSLEDHKNDLTGYNACFYCAGVSSAGMDEKKYSYITLDTTLAFAETVLALNPDIFFGFISGSHTDSSEKGKAMWARVKGKTENTLDKLGFKKLHHFRPGFMKPVAGQKNIKGYYKIIDKIYPFLKFIFPKQGNTIEALGLAMINTAMKGYEKHILEVPDINKIGKE